VWGGRGEQEGVGKEGARRGGGGVVWWWERGGKENRADREGLGGQGCRTFCSSSFFGGRWSFSERAAARQGTV
jgi:hypothetical protein